MELNRFGLYEKDNKKGIVDLLLNRIVLDSKFDVVSFIGDAIKLENGDVLSLEEVLKNCDYFNSKIRYVIVEDDCSKKVGLYDTVTNQLKIACNCEKIEYLTKERAFLVVKMSGKRKISYEKLKYLKYHPSKQPNILTLNNLSLYYSKQIMVNSKTGKKAEIIR